MKSRVLIMLMLLLCGMGLLRAAEVAAPDFDGANKLYEQGKYGEAIAAYDRLLQASPGVPAVWFNYGNALFKSGQLGRAVTAYRIAERMAPRDPDIRANLQFVRKAVTGKEEAQAAGWRDWLNRLTPNEWTWAAVASFWILFGLLAIGQFRTAWRPGLRPALVVAGLALATTVVCLVLAVRERQASEIAVVIVKEAVAHVGPVDDSKNLFSLPDGTELTVIDRKQDWVNVRDSGQRVGWVKQNQTLLLNSLAGKTAIK